MSIRIILFIIVIAQFCCTSLWFAGNVVVSDLVVMNDSVASQLIYWVMAVQFGFVVGTLVLAFFLIADRFSPSRVFLISGLMGAGINLCLLIPEQSFYSIAAIRFFTGCCLAGIYPVGMKIAADYKKEGLGLALGFLVGALVLGTAFPYLLSDLLDGYSWEYVIMGISLLTILGAGLLWSLVPDGPYRKAQNKFVPSAFIQDFKNKPFRAAAFGYFGHMWELYAFWGMVPLALHTVLADQKEVWLSIDLQSFLIIACGGLGCISGGALARKWGSQKVSFLFLLGSLICCLLSPWLFGGTAISIFIYLLIWGFLVAGDSPQFSTLVAQYATPENKGSALTIVNGIGFSITIVSLLLINYLTSFMSLHNIFLILVPGPLIGCWIMARQFFRSGEKIDLE